MAVLEAVAVCGLLAAAGKGSGATDNNHLAGRELVSN